MFTAIICLAFLHSIVAYGQAPADKKSAQTLLYKTGNPADWPKKPGRSNISKEKS